MKTSRALPRIAFTQPYVPAYREALWQEVVDRVREGGSDLKVFYGGDRDQLAAIANRGDAIDAEWCHKVPVRTLPARPDNKFIFREIPEDWRSGILLTEMQVTNANAWRAKALRQPYVTLGHGKSYTAAESRGAAWLETRLNISAQRALTYLPAGRQEVLQRTRLPASRVVSFNNTTDTRRIRELVETQTETSIENFRARYSLPRDARVALYIGALTDYKRIDILFAAARLAFAADPRQWLVIAGDGALQSEVHKFADDTGRVVWLGQAGPKVYAPAAKLAEIILNPGRVGLLAVDALAMKLPILTTTDAVHAPEVDYLVEGVDVHTVRSNPQDFATAWLELRETDHCSSTSVPTVERSAATIAETVLEVAREWADRQCPGS
ncbi:hypothetical protein AXA44_11300 [Rhodococcus sp. SC4]|nr:hypothetical protein AXA44_11300 [Rhodococcus sp. SC4]RZL80724.1 MAG: glycosyltransferase [Rhodococcus sp. (in: high G+C Gram-positive bacteria)]